MTRFSMGGEILRVIYTEGAKVCSHCEEYHKYDTYRTGIMVRSGSEELELVIHKSWEDCATMYATLEDDNGGGVGDYLIVVHQTGEPMDASHEYFSCTGQRRMDGEDV